MSHKHEHDPEVIRRLDEIERQNREILREIRHLRPRKFTISITQENSMSTTPVIVIGTASNFAATLNENGSPYVPPVGTTFVPSFTWSASDPSLVLVPSSDTTSVSVTAPAGDTSTTATLGASGLDPNGNPATPGTLAITIQAGTTNVFSISIAPVGATPSFRR